MTKEENRVEHLIFIDNVCLMLQSIVLLVDCIGLIDEVRLTLGDRGFDLFIGENQLFDGSLELFEGMMEMFGERELFGT